MATNVLKDVWKGVKMVIENSSSFKHKSTCPVNGQDEDGALNILKETYKFWPIAALPFGSAMVDLTITSEIMIFKTTVSSIFGEYPNQTDKRIWGRQARLWQEDQKKGRQ